MSEVHFGLDATKEMGGESNFRNLRFVDENLLINRTWSIHCKWFKKILTHEEFISSIINAGKWINELILPLDRPLCIKEGAKTVAFDQYYAQGEERMIIVSDWARTLVKTFH